MRPLLVRINACSPRWWDVIVGTLSLSPHFQLGQELAALCFYMVQSEGSRPSSSKRVEATVSMGKALGALD